jgi:cation transport ATPase
MRREFCRAALRREAAPPTALSFISPILCMVAMSFTDLTVTGNALRLLRWH